jgi:predicted nucleic acid-binding protein
MSAVNVCGEVPLRVGCRRPSNVRVVSLAIAAACESCHIVTNGAWQIQSRDRVKPIDLLSAAVAATEDSGVLHFEHDYDTIAKHTSLSFESLWAAPASTEL